MTIEKLSSVLAQRPLGLVFDIDGTLSPIAPTPDEASLYPGVASLLAQARDHSGVQVAIVTGRTVEDGAALVNVDGITYIGTHGLEWSYGLPTASSVWVVPEALPYARAGERLLDLVEQQLADLPGLLIERKRVGGAIHYRLSPDHESAHQQILAVLTEPARRLNMRISEGKQMLEIKPPLAINKGQALCSIVQHFELRSVIFAGDDLTDLDAIVEVPRLRREGVAALSVAVKHADTPPELLQDADMVVNRVEGMVALLRNIVASL